MTGTADPAMFAPLTPDENRILSMHLTSGWYKQAAVYPALSGPWQETEALLKDLSEAHHAALQARLGAHQARLAAWKKPPARISEPKRREPEAGQ
jgi:hypothetical protein